MWTTGPGFAPSVNEQFLIGTASPLYGTDVDGGTKSRPYREQTTLSRDGEPLVLSWCLPSPSHPSRRVGWSRVALDEGGKEKK